MTYWSGKMDEFDKYLAEVRKYCSDDEHQWQLVLELIAWELAQALDELHGIRMAISAGKDDGK